MHVAILSWHQWKCFLLNQPNKCAPARSRFNTTYYDLRLREIIVPIFEILFRLPKAIEWVCSPLSLQADAFRD